MRKINNRKMKNKARKCKITRIKATFTYEKIQQIPLYTSLKGSLKNVCDACRPMIFPKEEQRRRFNMCYDCIMIASKGTGTINRSRLFMKRNKLTACTITMDHEKYTKKEYEAIIKKNMS